MLGLSIINTFRGGSCMSSNALFRMKFFAVSLVICLVTSLPLCSAASTPGPERSWDNLKQLQSGTRIQVVTMDLHSKKGDFVSVSDDVLVFRVSKSDRTVKRADVYRVINRDKNHHIRNGLIGMAAGATIIGTAAVVGTCRSAAGCSGDASAGIVGGLIIGTIGFAFGNHQTVYKAERITNRK
jgi:hypothetical protein